MTKEKVFNVEWTLIKKTYHPSYPPYPFQNNKVYRNVDWSVVNNFPDSKGMTTHTHTFAHKLLMITLTFIVMKYSYEVLN